MMTNHDEAMEILQTTWVEQNRPTAADELIRTLGVTMDRCQRRGIIWPRIFLKRKGELQRGEFNPRTEIRTLPNPDSVRFTAPSHPKIPQEWIDQAIAQSVADFEGHSRERAPKGTRKSK